MTSRNRLADATSPYLLQHATNPVDWYPWGPEAFAEARRRDVPIFLSIGYSTCYWCHVMERESFEHEATAELLNGLYVPVKLDREERPDIDEIYMAATVTMTGRGGWPMSVFIEPNSLRPFWCGTYYPREPAMGMPSFRQVLAGIGEGWKSKRTEIETQAEELADAVAKQVAERESAVPLGAAAATSVLDTMMRQLDRTHGGFGGAPKFPQPSYLEFLLDVRDVVDEEDRAAIDAAVRLTLDKMMIGGIHDHVGGGFHRYAVDATWTVPHFEKMLYDNAQLLSLYTRASTIYDDGEYRRVAARTADYVIREMALGDEPGSAGFATAQDAEVDHREGLNFLWTRDEVLGVLGPEFAAFALKVFGLDAGPNFRDPHHDDAEAMSVLRLAHRPEIIAEQMGLSPETFRARLDDVSARLLEVRDRRKQPLRDDKVLVSWNAMMIHALWSASRALNIDLYADVARRAAEYLLTTHRTPAQPLLRVSRGGKAHTPGMLEDYAWLALAIESSGGFGTPEMIEHSDRLIDDARERFGDGAGGFFDASSADDLFVRGRSTHDGATPCASGVMLSALLARARRTGDESDRRAVSDCLASLSGAVAPAPAGATNIMRGVLAMMRERSIYAPFFEFDDAGTAQAPAPEQIPVRILASEEEVLVRPDTPASFRIALEIEPGYHVVAADPGKPEGLMPMRVGLVQGSGVAVYADYPPGDLLQNNDENSPRVYSGRVEFEVAIEHAEGVGAGPGEPFLGVSFQVCSDTACLEPTTVKIGVHIRIGSEGDTDLMEL